MSLTHLLQYTGYGLVFLTMISVLVAGHELGHYLVARWFRMGVEEFSIGFGRRPILIWMRRKYIVPILSGEDVEAPTGPSASDLGKLPTAVAFANSLEGAAAPRPIERVETAGGPALQETTEFTVRPWPLGGFVRIKGMMPEEDGSETRIPGGFYSKAPWKRFLVLLAGPVFSILGGVAVLLAVMMVQGEEMPVDKPILSVVVPGGPAAKAGLQDGDRVVAIDGHKVDTFYGIILALRDSKGESLRFEVVRGGLSRIISVTPDIDKEPTPVRGPDLKFTDKTALNYKIGVQLPIERVRLSLPAAFVASAEIPVEAVDKLVGVVRKPAEFSDMVAGPASIVSATAEATHNGFWEVLQLAGLLSISVGILNLLPAPPLDGGQMAMAVAEMLRGGKRLSIRAQAIAGGIGLTFVAALIFAALAVDFKRFTGPTEKPFTPPKVTPAK